MVLFHVTKITRRPSCIQIKDLRLDRHNASKVVDAHFSMQVLSGCHVNARKGHQGKKQNSHVAKIL